MDKSQDIAEALHQTPLSGASPRTHRAPRQTAGSAVGTVRLSVAGQVIHVPWDDLLVPSRWFAAPAPSSWRD